MGYFGRVHQNSRGPWFRKWYAEDDGLEWYYFPEMVPDEVLVFKVFDSDKSKGVPFTAHTAFDHPDTPAYARPRESVESRALVFF